MSYFLLDYGAEDAVGILEATNSFKLCLKQDYLGTNCFMAKVEVISSLQLADDNMPT